MCMGIYVCTFSLDDLDSLLPTTGIKFSEQVHYIQVSKLKIVIYSVTSIKAAEMKLRFISLR